MNKFLPIPLFPVPVWRDRLPDFYSHKEQMVTASIKYRNENPGDAMSNLNGYQSPKLLHSVPEFKYLFDYVTTRIRAAAESIGLRTNIAISEAWVNFNDKRECMNFQHIHGGVLSGIFYLSVPAGSGKLNLVNPGMNTMWEGLGICNERNQFTSEALTVPPEEGMLVIWPSYLPHAVGTNSHDLTRISIAFNTTIVEN